MPVTQDFQHTHQWVRELRRNQTGQLWGIYFRLSDGELVNFGHYGQPMVEISASEAIRQFSANPTMGFQVLVPRRVEAREIIRAKPLPQVTGWRYFPEAKGRRPCGCPACQYGTFGARKLREAYEAEMNR